MLVLHSQCATRVFKIGNNRENCVLCRPALDNLDVTLSQSRWNSNES